MDREPGARGNNQPGVQRRGLERDKSFTLHTACLMDEAGWCVFGARRAKVAGA